MAEENKNPTDLNLEREVSSEIDLEIPPVINQPEPISNNTQLEEPEDTTVEDTPENVDTLQTPSSQDRLSLPTYLGFQIPESQDRIPLTVFSSILMSVDQDVPPFRTEIISTAEVSLSSETSKNEKVATNAEICQMTEEPKSVSSSNTEKNAEFDAMPTHILVVPFHQTSKAADSFTNNEPVSAEYADDSHSTENLLKLNEPEVMAHENPVEMKDFTSIQNTNIKAKEDPYVVDPEGSANLHESIDLNPATEKETGQNNAFVNDIDVDLADNIETGQNNLSEKNIDAGQKDIDKQSKTCCQGILELLHSWDAEGNSCEDEC